MTKKTFEFRTDIDIAEFISERAHDLRSPYNHVVGFTKMVLNGQSGPLTDLQKKDLSTSYKSALRTLWLMNNMIDMARLSIGNRSIYLSNVDINQVLEQAIAHWKKFNYEDNSTIASLVLVNSSLIKADEALYAVHQGRFARVRFADQGDKAAFFRHVSCSSLSSRPCAAPCCAARFDVARPLALAPFSSRASISKTGAWSGPDRPRT